jgi:hypothetical protein
VAVLTVSVATAAVGRQVSPVPPILAVAVVAAITVMVSLEVPVL